MVKRHYGVRTDRYKLIHFYYDVDEWEMYDLEKDPHEMKSVYDDPTYASVQKNLHKRLTELRTQYGDSDELDQKFIQEFTKKK
jgi:arylsulfatase A-like enzyme